MIYLAKMPLNQDLDCWHVIMPMRRIGMEASVAARAQRSLDPATDLCGKRSRVEPGLAVDKTPTVRLAPRNRRGICSECI